MSEIVLELKNTYPQIKIIGAIPCKTQDKLWKEKDKQRYKNMLEKLDGVRCIYDEECMLERNRFMINNLSLVIALFKGTNDETKKTLDCAKRCNIETVIN